MKLLIFTLCLIFALTPVYAEEPDVKAAGAVLIEKESKRVLWSRNADAPMPPASTTKIMTAVIVLENNRLDKVITADKEAAAAPKVKMGLEAGEKITVEQLLCALLMQSSNDAAVALAIGTEGSVEAFCKKMNEKAAEIGCKDTFFETPNGIDKGEHHSTPYDMALIAAYALDNPDFVRISKIKNIDFSTDKKTYSITNKNRFLNEYNGAIGIKTGFTGKAGHCFAGAAQRNGMTLVSVVFASGWGSAGKERKWTDTKALMNYGFGNFGKIQLVNKGAAVRDVTVQNGKQAKVGTVLAEDYTTALKNGEKYSISLELPKYLEAPIKKGARAGTANIIINGVTEAKIPVVAAESVDGRGFWEHLKTVFEMWASMAA